MKTFTVLHTSDWHLGQQLHHRRRDEEFQAFLSWLAGIIEEKHVDALIVAGDVFDSSAPGPATQKMYYDFLLTAARAGARHIIITAGNHDSPTLLAAASPLLARLQIHIVGTITPNYENELLILKDVNGMPEMIVCAVPHIRERDARLSYAGESNEDKEHNLYKGIKDYYERLGNMAEKERGNREIPIVATGHLFISSATPSEEERNLYIGSLGQISADIFPPFFDYVALGHLHRAQRIDRKDTIRYSGSPLPMSFPEARYDKQVILIRFQGKDPEVTPVKVPCFRKLMSIKGNRTFILSELDRLKREEGSPIWLELHHNGEDDPFELQKLASEAVAGSTLQILCIKTDYEVPGLQSQDWGTSLEELSPQDIFQMRLDEEKMPEEERQALREAFQELLAEFYEQGRMEEN